MYEIIVNTKVNSFFITIINIMAPGKVLVIPPKEHRSTAAVGH